MKLLWLGEGSVTDEIRLRIPSDELSTRGIRSEVAFLPNHPFDPTKLLEYHPDITILCRPHTYGLIELLKAQGSKIICDIDDDFWAIPKSHVGYNAIGPGNPSAIEAMNRSMEQADLITTPSHVLAGRLSLRFGKSFQIIPNGWTHKMLPMWSRPSPASERVRIGWSGTITHREDIKLALKPVIEVCKKTGAMVVIGGDPQIYKMLYMLPEPQKMFVPMLPYEIYPQTLSYFDIGIAPLVNDLFNRAKSDVKLYEFGLAVIPWVASPLPMYEEWAVGGYLASDHRSWIQRLTELVASKELRAELAASGWEKAQDRDERHIADLWLQTFRAL